jgi:hypothetical protein
MKKFYWKNYCEALGYISERVFTLTPKNLGMIPGPRFWYGSSFRINKRTKSFRVFVFKDLDDPDDNFIQIWNLKPEHLKLSFNEWDRLKCRRKIDNHQWALVEIWRCSDYNFSGINNVKDVLLSLSKLKTTRDISRYFRSKIAIERNKWPNIS